MADFNQTWETLLENIRPKVSEANYNNWFKQIKFINVEEKNVKLGAPNNFVKGWIIDYYQDMIIQELYALTNKNFALYFEIMGEKNAAPPPEAPKVKVVEEI